MKPASIVFFSTVLTAIVACSTPKSSISEKCSLIKKENENGISFEHLKGQNDILDKHEKVRGVIDGYLVSLATEGIKKVIDNRKKRYTAQFNIAVTDLHFYNNLSTQSTFDPTGIKFQGFSLVRVVKNNKKGTVDTAFIADFVLDTTNTYEIANNGIFRLKMNQIDYRFPKAKMRSNHRINIDFEITFTTSYINDQGNFFYNVPLGKFYYGLRNAPVSKSDPDYEKYYDSLKNTRLSGYSFIVPRSFGYYVADNNQLMPSYSWGNYSITAVVKESSKNAFIDQLIFNNSQLILDASKAELNKASKRYLNNSSNAGKKKS